jgi:hypothetical protein
VRIGLDEAARMGSASGWTLEQGAADRTPLKGSRRWSRPMPEGRHYRYRFDYCGQAVDFFFDPDGSTVRVAWTDRVSDSDVAVLVSGPVVGRALRLRGVHCLHATTLTVAGRAIALLGPSGAGKSTLAAALLRAGGSLLSEDQSAFAHSEPDFLALPGQTGLRLWRDSVESVAPADGSARLLWPAIEELEKFVIEVPTAHRAGGAAPLAGVFLLAPRTPEVRNVEVTDLAPAERVAVLCGNVYGGLEPSREVRVRELAFFSRMAAHVPVQGLRLPHGLDRIVDVAGRFLERIRTAAA